MNTGLQSKFLLITLLALASNASMRADGSIIFGNRHVDKADISWIYSVQANDPICSAPVGFGGADTAPRGLACLFARSA